MAGRIGLKELQDCKNAAAECMDRLAAGTFVAFGWAGSFAEYGSAVSK